MYDGIFDDFNTIKRHCKRNGDIPFEESAVFELLENLFPIHGSVQTVQMVIEMLDAQRIRDCKDSSNEPRFEVLNSDKSNDADSIIEVQVPQKIHPFVDLTDNSPESDDALIIENVTIENHNSNIIESDLDIDLENSGSGISDNEYHGLSDPDITKNFEDDWSQTVDDMIRATDAPPLAEYLAMLEEPKKSNINQLEGDQSNFGIAEEREISEILEENNNDPNNNLDGGIFDEEPTDANNAVNNNSHRIDTLQDSRNSNSNDMLIKELIDPIPGCSKDTETKVNIRLNSKESFPHTVVRQSASPIPGCSKDFDDSNDFESSVIFDESIQNDAICIQEIVPWANLETIYSILKKHSNSLNRKQLTLWDLMSEESSHTNTAVNKRKQNSDICIISKKSPKLDANDDIDEPLLDLTATLQSSNTVCNESSDSQSSKISECNESNSEVTERNQNEQISEDTESTKILSLSKKDSSNSNNNSVDFSNELSNNVNNQILIDESANLMPANIKIENQYSDNSSDTTVPRLIHNHSLSFTDHPIKKERNETVVSGSLNEHSVIHSVNETEHKNNFFPLISKTSSNERFGVNLNFPNMNDNKFNNVSNVTSAESDQSSKNEVEKIKRDLEETANFFLNSEPFLREGHQNTTQEPTRLKPNVVDLIRPSKLVIQHTAPQFKIKQPATTTFYIRPATFNYNINSDMHTSITERNTDFRNLNNRHTSSDNQADVSRPTVLQQNDLISRHAQNLLQQKAKKMSTGKQVVHSLIMKSTIAPAKKIASATIVRNGNVGVVTVNPVANMVQSIPLNRVNGSTQTITSAVANHTNPAIYQQKIRVKPVPVPTASIPIPHKPVTIIERSGLRRAEPTARFTSSKPMQIVNIAKQSSTSDPKLDLSSNSIEVPDRAIYNKLRSIFPEVRKSYVKKICINPPNMMSYNDKEHILNTLIDHLLREGHNHLRPIPNHHYEQQQAVSTLSVDEQYEYLLGIFPDADPTYLRDFVERNYNSEQVLEQFIQQKLETRDYPTKEQYLAKIKTTEQQKQYTTDFKVENFLELFPDPFKHFENETRQCTYQPIAMEFLKSFFNKNKVNTISRQYIQGKYNLSLTAKALSLLGSDMKSRRTSIEMPTEDIPLLQELAFVKNKTNIQNYINTLRNKEEQLFKELQEKNLLLTCQCCFNDECMPTKSSECNEGHVFCFECIIRGTESTLADGEAHVRCFTECKSEFSLATLQKVLPPTKFSALLKKRQAAEVMAAEVDGLVSCPFCHFASIPPLEDKVFKCLNPECMKETCRQCKELNHVPLRCDEVVKTDKARRMIEEKMTEALLRTCYKCKRQFYKEDGCNKMKCNCGALMCYLCDKPVSGYAHFNPQGGTNTHLCPLWSDDKRLNAEAVRKVAEDVKKAIQKNNPNLQIDMESLLPKLPPKTKGPHDDIPNANQLPEHIRRLAGAAP